MKKTTALFSILLLLVFTSCSTQTDEEPKTQTDQEKTPSEEEDNTTNEKDPNATPIERHGALQVKGNRLTDKDGDVVQLRGMSLFWSQWQGKYFNNNTISWLTEEWGIDIIRAAMGVDHGGYIENPETEIAKVENAVQSAIDNGIYVIIDYHSHEASKDPQSAVAFFGLMAEKYADVPNVIYEIYNEPLADDWKTVLFPYSEKVIAAIRAHDPDNLILCGTRTWSQRVDEVVEKPLNDPNVAYVLHFYAGTHTADLRKIADKAMVNNLCLFVSEFGVINADGDGDIDYEETKLWMKWMDDNQLSWCNWAVSDKDEGASIFKPGTSAEVKPLESDLTESGLYLRNILLNRNYDKP
ncbi:glycoside hydrolase family 5 protein [Reichenbachiella ulvae]|uniref:Glycoside hydrolase family 5 protein n=1 Tax=Reichenbachiella ulvae TaxID=2980104 RepID=A0ABT3D178_9BACT|nr:glycoside hydrolase family 5 protein [Reichenbachiella ulvae]MCV9389188.1 glycoside hydrolase family 5 protein [Reichenbachiella ulvae]